MKNPPAFPRPYSHDLADNRYGGDRLERFATQDGMTLRDYFAAKALQGMLAAYVFDPEAEPTTIPMSAEDAYRYADAMLAEGEK